MATRSDLNQIRQRLVDAGIEIGNIHHLGDTWSLFFRDPDGMELEVAPPPRVNNLAESCRGDPFII